MSGEITTKDTYKKPESYFGSYEEEYRIVGHCAAIRVMQAIASSATLNQTEYTDKSVPAFAHSICDDLVRTKLGFSDLVKQWLASGENNTNRIKALETFGVIEAIPGHPHSYGIKSNFELALDLEFSDEPLVDEIKKISDIARHDSSIDYFVSYYMAEIEEKRQGSKLSIDFLVPTVLGNIEFYVGHEDPRQYQ